MSHRANQSPRKLWLTTLVICCLIGLAKPVAAIDFELFKDPEDGAFDLSDWLLSKGGFMPVPIIITEPAVGTGFGLAAVFFHGKLTGRPNPNNPDQQLPPSMSVAVAAYTSNDTWFAGGGHVGHWKQDSIRYTGFIGIINLNIDLYAGVTPLAFNIDGGFRYLIARQLNMHVGIDVARGPEDTAVYLQMGHAWAQ